jgi:putative ABC transport system substrate-binding protein
MKRAVLALRAATAVVSAAIACAFGAHAQQQSLPVVGYLSFTSPDERPTLVAAFRQGLQQAGFVVGQNVAIEYRSAGGKFERLPALAAELAKIPAAVIAATGGEAVARAAKAATSQIPIVFTSSSDVVKGGLVASLNRPGGNVTGHPVGQVRVGHQPQDRQVARPDHSLIAADDRRRGDRIVRYCCSA